MAIRTINSVRNPIWANYERTMLNMEVDFDELDEDYVSFTAVESGDPEPHTAILWANAVAGLYGPIADWVPPKNIVGADAMEHLRFRRNNLLTETDYIEMPTKWATLSAEKQAEWSAYRNALRDLPANYPDAELRWNEDYSGLNWHNLVWPAKPS